MLQYIVEGGCKIYNHGNGSFVGFDYVYDDGLRTTLVDFFHQIKGAPANRMKDFHANRPGLPRLYCIKKLVFFSFLYISARYTYVHACNFLRFLSFPPSKGNFSEYFSFSITSFTLFLFASSLSAHSILTIRFANSCCSDTSFLFHPFLYCSPVPFQFYCRIFH